MTKSIKAIYEKGVIRPLQPLELPEGSRLKVIVTIDEPPKITPSAAEILAEIAAQPLEGRSDSLSGREHDSTLYSSKH